MRVVYLIRNQSAAGDCYKIGFTKNVKQRLKNLQTGNPNPLDVVCTFASTQASLLETVLHRTFRVENIRDEWFQLTDEQVSLFLDECATIEKTLNLLKENTYWNKSYVPIDFVEPPDEAEDDGDLWFY